MNDYSVEWRELKYLLKLNAKNLDCDIDSVVHLINLDVLVTTTKVVSVSHAYNLTIV